MVNMKIAIVWDVTLHTDRNLAEFQRSLMPSIFRAEVEVHPVGPSEKLVNFYQTI
jgi:hypothetical protein